MDKIPLPSFKVALLIETSSQIGRDLLQGIQLYAHEHGSWQLDLQPGGLNQVLPDPKTWKGTGIISRAASPNLFAEIQKTGLPTVFFTLSDRQREALPPHGWLEVLVDADTAAQLAAHHLLERGLRNFAFVGNAGNPDWSKRREHAFARHLARESFVPHVYPVERRQQRKWVEESRRMIIWLRQLAKPVGIMAANDARGLQVLNACQQSALSVPDEVLVIGVENDELICSLCSPPLTSISLATVEGGYRAAQALHHLMIKKAGKDLQLLIRATQVIARESTAAAFAPDQRVEEARRYIIQNVGDMIQVRDVVEHVGVSRRSLEVHFARCIGHSLLSEILQLRIDRVKGLLISSASPIHLIAKKGGFSTANYMCKVFKKRWAVRPKLTACNTRRQLDPEANGLRFITLSMRAFTIQRKRH